MPKDKITKVTTPKAPKNKTTRVDNSEWKNSSPLSGSGESWSSLYSAVGANARPRRVGGRGGCGEAYGVSQR